MDRPLNQPRFLLGSVLLEVNRHRPGKVPTFRVSAWTSHIAQAGFEGLELWENHVALGPEDEVALLRGGPLPVVIFNSYAGFLEGEEGPRQRAADLVEQLGAAAVKFNFGADGARRSEMLRNILAWSGALPMGVRLLCECHAGTIAQWPEDAAQLLDELGPPSRFGAIVHSADGPESLEQWFTQLERRITHVHVVLSRNGIDTALAVDGLRYLRDRNFAGTYTLEFTEGMNTPDETIEMAFANAVRDLRTVRELVEKQ